MNQTILTPRVNRIATKLWQPVKKKKTKFKPVKLHLKTDHVSHPACVKGLGKYI